MSITVNDLIDGAIIAGFQKGSQTFLESINDQLENHVAIMESGDANSLLQQMIEESENEAAAKSTMENLEELNTKLSKILS